LAARVAVGAAGGGGGGGVTFAICLWHAARKKMPEIVAIKEKVLNFPRVMLSSIYEPTLDRVSLV
jgi:hypothetical protein